MADEAALFRIRLMEGFWLLLMGAPWIPPPMALAFDNLCEIIGEDPEQEMLDIGDSTME